MKKLQEIRRDLLKEKLDAILVSAIPNIIYLTGFSAFSTEERECFLLITRNKQYILTDGRYSEAVIGNIPHFKLFEISGKFSYEQALKKLVRINKIRSLGIEENNISIIEYRALKKAFTALHNFSISQKRVIKYNEEISKIKAACKIGDCAFDYILGKIKPEITEKELSWELEMFIKKVGADLSFRPIIAFGKNSSVPHHLTSDQRLTTNSIVLMDFGVRFENYCSDMSRTIFLGKASSEQKKMYNTVLDAQQKAIEFFTSGDTVAKAADVDKVARNHIKRHGYPPIPHSLGHGIGLEVHEAPHLSPRSKDKLESGMVFSIEPGIYIPKFGGIRIEDIVALTKSAPQLITLSPKKLIEI